MRISERVLEIKEGCLKDQIELVSGDKTLKPLVYNQREVLRRINFYLASKYLERDDDALFWNLSSHRIVHFAKNIEADTKDFMPYGEGEINFFQSWALRKVFRQWADDNSFYLLLNQLAEGLATYGSIVLKEVKKDGKLWLEEVKLDNIYFNQTVDRIKDTDIVEMHYLTKAQLRDKYNADDVAKIEKLEKSGRAELWEFWGYDKDQYKHYIGYGYGDKEIILLEEEAKKCIYHDFRLGYYKGRWLGVGVVERLFKHQEQANKLVNQNDEANSIASLLLLRSQDPQLQGNILQEAVSGQIITSSDLQTVGIDNRNFNSFVVQLQTIEAAADKLCLTPDIVQGEQMPSGTPFRSLAVQNVNSINAFTAYKQNLSEGIAKILKDRILPSQVKSLVKEDILEMAEDDADVEMFDEILLMRTLNEEEKKGRVITTEFVAQVQNEIARATKMKGRRLKIDDNFFNFKWGIKITPTNDSYDKQATNDAMFNALQMQGSNPANSQTPLFRQYLENNGLSYWKLTPKQMEQLQQSAGGQPQAKQPDKLLAEAGI